MKRLISIILALVLVILPGCGQSRQEFMRGVDVSSLRSQLNSGVRYYDFDGNLLDGPGFMEFMAGNGVNWVRLRVWNAPYDANGNGYGGGNCDLETAYILGKWATDAGLRVFLDFHYSDFWADPSRQNPPKAWQAYNVSQLAEAIGEYTYRSLVYLLEAGVDVGMVQIGNETNYALCGVTDWEGRCQLYAAGSAAVRAANSDILVAIHFTDPQNTEDFLFCAEMLAANSVDYDVFAASFYPYWHGSAENLTACLSQIANHYGKKVCIAETAWPYTLADGDGHPNSLNESTSPGNLYSYDVQGQTAAITDAMRAVQAVGDLGIGVFYWEPAWIPAGSQGNRTQLWEVYGCGWASSYAAEYDPENAGVCYGGSSWDNQALFSFNGHPLGSWEAFQPDP